jgi:hypothetical protein
MKTEKQLRLWPPRKIYRRNASAIDAQFQGVTAWWLCFYLWVSPFALASAGTITFRRELEGKLYTCAGCDEGQTKTVGTEDATENSDLVYPGNAELFVI